ncbi:MAG: TIGR04282 family arsenosugar biosynthesis glycosyltransferase [Proteobacteria bacterium]|nr:TIGR04282 family arsenosugar biosynthesis glycosyltransferase [Pseudomonadota bacterium]
MRCIILFAKAPVPGEVKTRLSPHLSPEDAALVQEAFIFDTLATLQSCKGVDLYIACHPSAKHPFYEEAQKRFTLTLIGQGAGHLGDRMKRVISQLKSAGYDEIVVLGSDSPSIPVKMIDDSFERLKKSDLVIGPSIDGGYYLIGFSGELPPIFDGINWGTESVFSETMERLKDSDIDCSVLPYWYDVDTIKELRFLEIHLASLEKEVCRETRKVFNESYKSPSFGWGQS